MPTSHGPDSFASRTYAIHEAAHAVAAHVVGFEVTSITSDPENSSGRCHIDRGFDPDEASPYVREHAHAERTAELLPKLKRDLAGRLAGIVAESIFGLEGNPAENECDMKVAEQLEVNIGHAMWARSIPRPPFASRERVHEYDSRMRNFVRDRVIEPYRGAIEALAERLEVSGDLTREQVVELFDLLRLPFNSIADDELP